MVSKNQYVHVGAREAVGCLGWGAHNRLVLVVENANGEGYSVRREHDGMLLPERFAHEDVRIEKRRLHFWHRHR